MVVHIPIACNPAQIVRKFIILLLTIPLAMVLPAISLANPDVYGVLPADIRVLGYSIADFDGDAVGELALLYTASNDTRLTIFREDSGHWSRWWDDHGMISLTDGNLPGSFETTDTNGDGRYEILTYYLTENNLAMTARILTLHGDDLARPDFRIILEDTTSPPGYPLLESEEQAHTVTFMRMATRKSSGYRRVYCWDGEVFEMCREVEWEKP